MLESLGIDVFDLIVAAVAVSLLPLAVDLVNTLAPQAQIGRIAQESIGYMLVCIVTGLITSGLILWAGVFLPFHMKYYSLQNFPHGVFHLTIAPWLLFHCYYHYFQAIRKGPGHPPKPKRQRKKANPSESATITEGDSKKIPNGATKVEETKEEKEKVNEKVNEKEKEGKEKEGKEIEKEVKEKEKEVKEKEIREAKAEGEKETPMCKICKAPKPHRAHHCKICQACSLVMDHHCPFLGNCVGQNNQRHFILFLIFLFLGDCYATFLSITPFLACVWQLDSFVPNDAELCALVGKHKYIVACTIILLIPLFCITTWQLFVVFTNTTTIESMKKAWATPIYKWPVDTWHDFKKGNVRNFAVLRGRRFGALLL
eukprot:Phypoly_transcript_10596.p1 GENE.Phypoly_transcript_10596~~Phypoly_transcript_10596.p1  ORF type:complete len:371 (+),score=71.20 Phypoly_transcript_10596:167-1279(+)